jgi:hypothetical protein
MRRDVGHQPLAKLRMMMSPYPIRAVHSGGWLPTIDGELRESECALAASIIGDRSEAPQE